MPCLIIQNVIVIMCAWLPLVFAHDTRVIIKTVT